MDQEGTPTLDRYAFSFQREAYDHCIPPQLTSGVTLHVKKLQWHGNIPGEEFEVERCPPTRPTEQELSETAPPGSTDCIWVGMKPSEETLARFRPVHTESPADDGGTSRKKPHKSNPGNIALFAWNKNNMTTIPHEPQALRVVVKATASRQAASRQAVFYALANHDDQTGLCTGSHIPWNNVFLFRPFRDNEARSIDKRRFASTVKIRALQHPDPREENSVPVDSQTVPGSNAIQTDNDLQTELLVKSLPESTDDSHIPKPEIHTPSMVEAGPKGNSPHETSPDENAQPSQPVTALDANTTSAETLNDVPTTVDNVSRPKAVTSKDGEATAEIRTMNSTPPTNTSQTLVSFGKSKLPLPNDDAESSTEPVDQATEATEKDDEADESLGFDLPQSEAAQFIVVLASRLEQRGGTAILNQCAAILHSIERVGAPDESSLLGVALNIPAADLSPEELADMFDEMKHLFPEIVEAAELTPKLLAWMVRGLELQGVPALEYELIGPFTIAFAIEMRSCLGGGELPDVLKRGSIERVTTNAREHALALVNPRKRKRDDRDANEDDEVDITRALPKKRTTRERLRV